MTLLQRTPQIVHETMPYEGTILKILLVAGIIIAVWTLLEEGAS